MVLHMTDMTLYLSDVIPSESDLGDSNTCFGWHVSLKSLYLGRKNRFSTKSGAKMTALTSSIDSVI